MINNINNFGVINFYENNNSNAKKEQANVEDITPVEMTPKKEQAPYEAAKKEQAYTPPVPREVKIIGGNVTYIDNSKNYNIQK